MSLIEINFDGIVGPSHNYAGLSLGNIASASHKGNPSYPRAAALQGVAKMRGNLARLGAQGFLLPLPRPNALLENVLAYDGSEAPALRAAASFSGDEAAAMTVAPIALPISTAARPTPPPAPNTNRVSPGFRSARCLRACIDVP